MIFKFERIPTKQYQIAKNKIVYCRPCALNEVSFLRDSETEIVLDVERMLRSCREHKTSFDKLFCECISHEVIHAILWREFGEKEWAEFDNLYYKLNRKKGDKLGIHKLAIGF